MSMFCFLIFNSSKILKNLVEPDKKIVANNSGTSTKKNHAPGTIKISSKAGDENAGNFLIGLPGLSNYQVYCYLYSNPTSFLNLKHYKLILFIGSKKYFRC